MFLTTMDFLEQSPSFPRKLLFRHSRESGNPGFRILDPRFRGDDRTFVGMTGAFEHFTNILKSVLKYSRVKVSIVKEREQWKIL